MHFPNELVVAIIESLGAQGLKSARLVSKTWCSYASILLFEKIYVAPNRIDLEVFNAITQHPIYVNPFASSSTMTLSSCLISRREAMSGAFGPRQL